MKRKKKVQTITERIISFMKSEEVVVGDLKFATALKSKIALIQVFTAAIRDSIQFEPAEIAHVHFLNNLSGCGYELRGAVTDGFWSLQAELIPLIRSSFPALSKGVLQAVAMDFDVSDHSRLLQSGLLDELKLVLTAEDKTLRSTAQALLRLLLFRCWAGGASPR